MPRRSVQKWEHGRDEEGSVYVFGLDYQGNAVVEFVFDDHKNIDGDKHYAEVIIERHATIRPLPITIHDGRHNSRKEWVG